MKHAARSAAPRASPPWLQPRSQSHLDLHTRLALDKHGGTWGLDRSAWVERRQGGGFERGHGRWRTRRPRRAAGDGLRHSQSPLRAEVPPEQSSLSARFLPLGGH